MNRYDYQPGRTQSRHAFEVRQIKGRYVVLGPYGAFAEWFDDAQAAATRSAEARQHFQQSLADAIRPTPNPASDPADDASNPANPMAFEVAGFGSDKDGFVVFDEDGQVAAKFAKKADADRDAARRRAAYRPKAQASPKSQPAQPGPAPSSSARASAMGAAGIKPVAHPSPTGPATAFANGFAAAAINPTKNTGGSAVQPGMFAGLASATASSGTGRSGLADAFERAFDASIGKAIAGAEKIVTGSLDAFKMGFASVRSVASNPAQGIAGVATSANRAVFGASVVAAFAAARARGLFGATVGGGAGAPGTTVQGIASILKRANRARRSSARVSRTAIRRAQAARRAVVSRIARSSTVRRGVSAAFGPAVAGQIGRKVVAGDIGLAATALSAFLKIGQLAAENTLEPNRRLAPYSGRIAQGFAQLELGDESRNLRLAKSAEGTAFTLARQVNGIRDGLNGLDQLSLGLGNRLGIAAAALVQPGIREVGNIAGAAAARLNGIDPGGGGIEGAINSMHEFNAGVFGGILGLLPQSLGGSGAGWQKGFEDAQRQARADRLKDQAGESELWTNFMQGAMNIPQGRPARPLKP